MADAPLKGLKVLELARILAGPWIGQTLADLGAQIIKVESPAGDDTRKWGPPFVMGANGEQLDAAYFHACNRGKKSVVIDFATAKGQEQIRDLAHHVLSSIRTRFSKPKTAIIARKAGIERFDRSQSRP